MNAAVMPAFKAGTDPRNDWLKWKHSFERFITANKVEDDNDKCNLLLVLGGLELQTYFDKITKWSVLAGTNDGTEPTVVLQYESAILSLDKYFAPQTNKRFERHLLHALKQDENEGFEEYIFRLQDQAKRCMFADEDDVIVDQVIEGCRSAELRKRLLTEDLTLNETVMLGKTIEEVQKQTKMFDKPSSSYTDGVVQRRKRDVTNVSDYGGPTPKRIHAVTPAGSSARSTGRGVFFVATHENQDEVLTLSVGGVPTKLLVDSGSPANIINATTFEHLKKHRANMINERTPGSKVNLRSFASEQKIDFSMAFEAEIMIPGEDCGVWTHFLVAPMGQTNLLSKGTAFALGVLKIGYAVNYLSPELPHKDQIDFPKVPDVRLKIHVDEAVQPVVQVARRLPVTMEADVEETILELLKKNITERAEGPLTWVSPLVPVRKSDGRIRLCVDMRAANKAVVRENYPMPNIDNAMLS
nr:uncharacterized protein LOC115256207 [Aedes albopictus]